MLDGDCWELTTWERRTKEIGYGLLPTPTVCGNYNRKGASKTSGDGFSTAWKNRFGNYPTRQDMEQIMGMPAGWTELEPLVTRKSLSAPLKHGAG